ncbi:Rho GTPaseactivating protein 12like, partial [Caligus rogercresseyi]
IHSSIPDGYEEVSEGDNKYIVNIFTGVRWYSARDGSGKVYYYEENGNESCWTLPNVAQSIQDTQHNSSSISSESPPPPSEAPPPNKGGGSGTFLSSPNFRIGSGDSQEACSEWFKEIQSVIARIHDSTLGQRDSLPPVSRVKSIKSSSKKFLGSSEDLPSSQPSANNIREKLKKFFLRRPTMEDLFRRGIIKNEPVFGSTLKELSANEASDVPLFVKKCVREIEKGDFLSSDGVYRQSGNLSTIQKIRLQVDQGNLAILETLDDVHVLTGALKLFFRELKEPLIPWDCVDDLLAVPTLPGRKARLRALKEILSKMTPPHRATLLCLLRHLDRVTEFKESNRMQIHNLAIVFGPTLMWPPPHHGASTNLALDMMQQNIIVETLLSHANSLV